MEIMDLKLLDINFFSFFNPKILVNISRNNNPYSITLILLLNFHINFSFESFVPVR